MLRSSRPGRMSLFDPKMLHSLVYWITERELIRKRRSEGCPKPWTADTLIRNYRWCNVRRLDDAVSCSLFAYFYPSESVTRRALLTAVMLGRLINWPPTLSTLTRGRQYDDCIWVIVHTKLRAYAATGAKVFTGAYIIPGVEGKTKVDSVYDTISSVRACSDEIVWVTMQQTHAHLMKFSGMGSFLAGQVVADLAHLGEGKKWPDRDTWAPLGPGSNRGMNRLLGLEKDRRMTQVEFEHHLSALIIELRPYISAIWEDRKLQAMDVQNCLCEFDKYRRLLHGEGTVRATYPGEPTGGLMP